MNDDAPGADRPWRIDEDAKAPGYSVALKRELLEAVARFWKKRGLPVPDGDGWMARQRRKRGREAL